MRSNRIEMLQETLQIINKGSYMANGKFGFRLGQEVCSYAVA